MASASLVVAPTSPSVNFLSPVQEFDALYGRKYYYLLLPRVALFLYDVFNIFFISLSTSIKW